jgi:YHS domain-containing protein
MTKKIIVFCIAVAVSLVAAMHRWNDSAHAIGVIKADGGTARHPVSLEAGEESYMLIATATVLPPYRGDVKVVLEGEPAMEYEIHSSGPIVDLGLYDWPKFKDNTFYNLKPKDRPALWVKMKPPKVDPVCNMAVKDSPLIIFSHGKEYRFCSRECVELFEADSRRYEGRDHARGRYTLAFYDTESGAPVLKIPVIIKGKGEKTDAAEHHH